MLKQRLKVPAIAAPMLLVSGPDLVLAACKAGVVGSFPTLNARTTDELRDWLRRMETEPREEVGAAPYAANLIIRASERSEADLALIEEFRAPIVPRIHAYGGLVFHDVATMRHAEKAIAAGVDGLILLTAGAGGHTGSANPFAFVRQVREIWDGIIILAGGISDGHAIRAAEALGADFAYLGTRFAATQESLAPVDYKELLTSQAMSDIITTDRISGLSATFMRGSIAAAGLDPDNLPPTKALFQPDIPPSIKAWRDVWSAGHGVGSIHDIPSVAELVQRLAAEYASPARANAHTDNLLSAE